MNIIKLLGIENKEDIISNFLVGLINESEEFRKSFLRDIIKLENVDSINVRAFTRIATSFGIPDIVVTIEGESTSKLLIIENKLRAEEGNNQTERYNEEGCIKELLENKNIIFNDSEKVEVDFRYLTLILDQVPTGNDFSNITYKDILNNLDVKIEDSILDRIYKDFLEILKEFYDGLDIDDNDKLIECLSKENDNDKAFIKFKGIMKDVRGLENVKMSDVGKIVGSGRVSFYSQIYKDSWLGADEVDTKSNMYKVTENSYDIHIEPSFDVFNKKITLPLHYETRPYIPKKKLEQYSSTEDYKAYIDKRNDFKSIVHNKIYELKDNNIKPYNGSNQIAYVKVSIDENTSVYDFKEIIKKYISIMVDIVDSCLEG